MYDKIYESKTGKYIILNKEPSVNNKSMVRIKFIDTNNECIVRKDNALSGNVREPSMKRGRLKSEIDFEKIYNSNYGPLKIIKELESIDGQRFVEIIFLNSNNTKVVNYYNNFRNCDFVNIKDNIAYNYNHEIGTDKTYKSNNYGYFKILSKTNEFYGDSYDPLVLIEFIQTGYRTIVRMSKALCGSVKDPYFPNIFGVGYLGEPDDIDKKIYNIWYKMLSRCYNENDCKYMAYGGIGVTVDPNWFSFAKFNNDIKEVDGYYNMLQDPFNYSFDKDLKQLHVPKYMRIYSKYTCTFITKFDNSKIRCYERNYSPYEIITKPDLNVSSSLKTMVKIVNKA